MKMAYMMALGEQPRWMYGWEASIAQVRLKYLALRKVNIESG